MSISYTAKFTTAAATGLLALTLGSGAALAKAHDQGVADGSPLPVNTGVAIQTDPLGIFPGPGVSAAVAERGTTASGNKGDNRVTPVVGNGANAD